MYVYIQQDVNKNLCTRNIGANYYKSLKNGFNLKACISIEKNIRDNIKVY